MNAADRAKLQQILVTHLEQALDQASDEITLPMLGRATLHHLAQGVITTLDAIEEIQNSIAEELPDNVRDDLGI